MINSKNFVLQRIYSIFKHIVIRLAHELINEPRYCSLKSGTKGWY